MAGYRTTGTSFTNATTKNDQMVRQRAAIRSSNESRAPLHMDLGIASDTSSLFSMPDDVFSESVRVFKLTDQFGQFIDPLNPIRGNPDFGFVSGNSAASLRMFNDVENRIDRPNKKGPNLVAPNINNLAEATNSNEGSKFTNRGFGWRDQRNEPGSEEARIGTYFSRHYNSESSSDNPPVFGEAKSPEGDTIIDYDQP